MIIDHRTGETDSWRAQTKPCAHQDSGKWSSDPIRDWVRHTCECLGVSHGGLGRQWPAMGSGALNTTILSKESVHHSYRKACSATKIHSTAKNGKINKFFKKRINWSPVSPSLGTRETLHSTERLLVGQKSGDNVRPTSQGPLSMEFFGKEYWSGLPFPPLGDLPDPGIELTSPASLALAGRFFTTVGSYSSFIPSF